MLIGNCLKEVFKCFLCSIDGNVVVIIVFMIILMIVFVCGSVDVMCVIIVYYKF